MKQKCLGIYIDALTLDVIVPLICNWIEKNIQKYVVTPNVEMITAAQDDEEFRNVLNNADLKIADSARIGWAIKINQQNLFKKILFWPFFLLPTLMPGNNFPIATGVDLMGDLIKISNEKGYRIGLLGGMENVAIRLYERLKETYPLLKLEFVQENIQVDINGNHKFFNFENFVGIEENNIISNAKEQDFYNNLNSRKLDILFCAFGHPKQEKWISKNIHLTNVSVMIGVGGAFDYLAGKVKRAPLWMRRLGLEWLYRLIQQPWRIARLGSLIKFVFLVLKS